MRTEYMHYNEHTFFQAWACNHVRFLLSVLCMWHSLLNCIVILQTAHYCLRNYTFTFILQFPCTYRQRRSCAQKHPDCISRPLPIFVILHRWIFDLKSFNLASTTYQVGYFHIWHVSHFSVIHHNVCDMCQLLCTQQMFSILLSWGQGLFLRVSRREA